MFPILFQLKEKLKKLKNQKEILLFLLKCIALWKYMVPTAKTAINVSIFIIMLYVVTKKHETFYWINNST